jgi:hypothetical protein
MIRQAKRHAERVLTDDVARFTRRGYRETARPGPLTRRLEADGRPTILVRLAQDGRVFGGTFALEVGTAEPVLPSTRGLTARGRGLVQLRTVDFRAQRGDAAGARLAERLTDDDSLVSALARVHFERIRVEPDGRAVIRHMGGSLVWFLLPPLVRPIPFVPEQVNATLAAIEAFADARCGPNGAAGHRENGA